MRIWLTIFLLFVSVIANASQSPIQGKGDLQYLRLLQDSASMVLGNAMVEGGLPNVRSLYTNEWCGITEGVPRWRGWWVQNSFGPSWSILPFADNDTFRRIGNSQALWFQAIGDGKRADANGFVAPIGSLCDCATPDKVYYKQGDGKTSIYDWGYNFAAAGVILQSQLILISRDQQKVKKYLPLLERSMTFVLRRWDPKRKAFLVGASANLLAPSYKGDQGGQAYLAETSVLMVSATDRLAEVETLAGNPDKARKYRNWSRKIKSGLGQFVDRHGCFARWIAKDGTRHGVYGQKKYGYLESGTNHDAIALNVVGQRQANRIVKRMLTIPGLRPNVFTVCNYPEYDDAFSPKDLFQYGRWINGGVWSGSEARMIISYCKTGRFDWAMKSAGKQIEYARKGWMDNPLSESGAVPFQGADKREITYDAFGPPAAIVFSTLMPEYDAETLVLRPTLPPKIKEITLPPLRWGEKKIFVKVVGTGAIREVKLGARRHWYSHDTRTVTLAYHRLPAKCDLVIVRR